MRIVVNMSGKEIDFEAAVLHMDDDIREALNIDMAPCTDQEFFTAYEIAHKDKFGDPWFLSGDNPLW